MSQLRKLKQKLNRDFDLKVRRQTLIFSFFFIFTIMVSFSMLFVCAMNNAPTMTTTLVSGSAWLVFDMIFGYAIKKKWSLLFDECSAGTHAKYNPLKTLSERKKDNWQGNCLKFVISIVVLIIHLVLLLILL